MEKAKTGLMDDREKGEVDGARTKEEAPSSTSSGTHQLIGEEEDEVGIDGVEGETLAELGAEDEGGAKPDASRGDLADEPLRCLLIVPL